MPVLIACIADPSQIAEARRNARQLALDIDFSEKAAEKVAIVVTEAGTNLLKHATRGEILVRTVGDSLEILALDSGPGIADIDTCLDDGYSTTGTAGTGLGAISRLSSYYEVYSRPGAGTALLARISSNGAATAGRASDTGVVQVAKTGQEVCGDHWGISCENGRRTFLLADGLGHGPEAARASTAAVDTLYGNPGLSPAELVETVHSALRHTRGAAIGIAAADEDRRVVLFAGLGNISATVFAPGEPPRRMVSTNGTAGVDVRHVREFTYPFPEGAALIMHSDGIGTHWSLADYPSLASRDAAVIAGVIYRDHSRRTDDATILVAR